MVDSNLQRENILPSEKAKAYKMKLEAIKRRAGRPSRNSVQVGQNFEGKTSREQIAENSPDSATQIQRYIRLTELEPELMQLVDEGKLNDDAVLGIMMEQKKPENWDLKLPMDKIRKYFPRSYTPQRMEETIIQLLEMWMKKRQRDQQR